MDLMPPILRKDTNYTNILSSIIHNNKRVSLDEIELLVDTYIQQLDSTIKIIQYNKDIYPSASLSNWRTGYEIVVLFRAWAQSITRLNDIDLFYDLGQRFLDYNDIISSPRITSPETIYRINNHPEHLKLEYTYDWLNPIFTKRELNRMYNKNHPSFRDIVERTKETNGLLRSLYPVYEDASKVIHFSMQSIEVVEALNIDQLISNSKLIIFEFLMDYLTIIEYYQNNDRLQIYSKNSKNVIRKMFTT